jgi:hypothetical protein
MRPAAATKSRQRMFAPGIMSRRPNVPTTIPRLISLEMIERPRTTLRQRPMIAISRIKPVIYVPIKPARPMKPRPCTDEYTPHKPVRPIVPIRRAIIRRIVEIPIRTIRCRPNLYNNLRGRHMRRSQCHHTCCCQYQRSQKGHIVHLLANTRATQYPPAKTTTRTPRALLETYFATLIRLLIAIDSASIHPPSNSPSNLKSPAGAPDTPPATPPQPPSLPS